MNNFCPQCGFKVIDRDDRFCRNCGSKLSNPGEQTQPPPVVHNSIDKISQLFLRANPSGQDLEIAKQMLESCLSYARNSPTWNHFSQEKMDDYSRAMFQKIYDAYPRAWTIWDPEYMANQVLREFKVKKEMS